MKARKHLSGLICVVIISLTFIPSRAAAESYDLRKVGGITGFKGSEAAKEILARNGFVVADPAFKQIFEPYIESPQIEGPSEKNDRGISLPSFITTDSAWHTYHVLLEEGVKQMEEMQSRNLSDFSRRLLMEIANRGDEPELEFFASVGLGLQDEQHRKTLTGEAMRIVNGLRTGSASVHIPIGFDLSPMQFRAQSFYTQSPELSDYFAARQWYAGVVFRLSNMRETKLAISLANLVNNDSKLLSLWKQLSDPLDSFLAPAEDGTIREYVEAGKTISGENDGDSAADRRISEMQKKLENRLKSPRVNDQLLSPKEYAEYSKTTKGFRLFPPRRLPGAVCFNNTVDPKIPGRIYPSGLDFFAASPVLRSPAAERALKNQLGKNISALILKTDCGPMPDSLYGEAMQLLTTLQKALPAQVPAALRTEAWSDLQLWTQLGAWAEQRHTWALHTKLSVTYAGIISPPKGMVAPYPDFFSGLARLSRRTADAFKKAEWNQAFESKAVASELLKLLDISKGASKIRDEKELEKYSEKLEQLVQFQNWFQEKHKEELENDKSGEAYGKLEKDLETLARRAASGNASESDLKTLRAFYDSRQSIPGLLNDFAKVCDRLTELAGKSLTGKPLTDDDADWIRDYGVTLAGFHFYYRNSYEVPRDDFPIVTRVFSNPLANSMLYAGLARPQALYVIVPNGTTNQLYRGAVMTYREFTRPNSQLLDDESWREMIFKGETPPAASFTRSFYAETSVAELLKKLRAPGKSEDANYGDVEELVWQIGSRGTEKDLPELISALPQIRGDEREDFIRGLSEVIAILPWERHQEKLRELLNSPDKLLSDGAAQIFASRPGALEIAPLISDFDHQPPRTRRLYLAIFSRLPQQTDETREIFLKSLHDGNDGVRWQVALAIESAKWNDEQSRLALLKTLDDTNEVVAAAAAHAMTQLGITNAAPKLFEKLKSRLQTAHVSAEELQHQSSAVMQDVSSEFNRSFNLLDPAHLETRFSLHLANRTKRTSEMRFPPTMFTMPTHDYNLTDVLIESLGNLNYAPAADELFKLRGGDYDIQATRALSKLAFQRLTSDVLATAKNKQIDSYLRERALVTLCNISATNIVREIVPLLDDATPIVYSRPLPGPEWRVCDRAAATIAILLGWESPARLGYVRPEQREQTMSRVRQWATQSP